jgi:TolB-like protein/DNA-binding winged helix-turn-helix (wHTH) protein/predicted Zn-dependent protease
METPVEPRRVVRFGVFEVDFQGGELRKRGVKPFQVLVTLLDKPGQVVTRDELRKKLWDSDTFVDFEHSLGTAINKIREALGDSADSPRFIETLPRRGYRFIGSISTARGAGGTEERSLASEIGTPVPASLTTHSKRTSATPLALLGALLGLIIVCGAIYEWKRTRIVRSPQHKIRLAVMPFQNLSGDAAQEYFSDGMTEEMITQLGRMYPERLGVIARTSAMLYKNARKSAAQICSELGADYLLEGSVRRAGNHVRITAQVIQCTDQTHLWAGNFERDLGDILGLQGDVAQGIAQNIQLALTPEDRARLYHTHQADPEAHQAYLLGLFFLNQRAPGALEKAVNYFSQAIARDPAYAQAYSGLSDSYSLLHYYGTKPKAEMMANQRTAALQAVALDDTLAEAHTSLAQNFVDEWDWPQAEKEFRRAIQLNANYSLAHLWYSWFLQYEGRLDEATSEARTALELDPVGVASNSNIGYLYAERHQYDKAIEQLQKSSELSPDYPDAHLELANVLFLARAYVKGYSELVRAAELSGHKQFAACVRTATDTYSRSSFTESMQVLAECRMRASKTELLPPYDTAVEYALAGNRSEAFKWLANACDERDDWLSYLKVDPAFDSLRSDQRFADLVRRVGLPLS